jgi:hypothetical protein
MVQAWLVQLYFEAVATSRAIIQVGVNKLFGFKIHEIIRKLILNDSWVFPPNLQQDVTKLQQLGIITMTEDGRAFFAAPIIRSVYVRNFYYQKNIAY